MEDLIDDLMRLEVRFAAGEVHVTAWREAPVLEVHKPDTPAPAHDALAAASALGLAARRSLGTVDARNSPLRKAAARRTLEGLSLRMVLACCDERLKK